MKKHRFIAALLTLALLVVSVAIVTAQETTPEADMDRPYLGIRVQETEEGVLVVYVYPDSPAAEAGIQDGDLIVTFDGDPITFTEFTTILGDYSVGDTVTLGIIRDGDPQDMTVTLAPFPDVRPEDGFDFRRPQPPFMQPEPFMPMAQPYLGVRLQTADEGVRVTTVEASSPAADSGLQVDDVITAVNGDAVTTPAEVIFAVRQFAPGDEVIFSVTRGEELLEVPVILGEAPGEFGMPEGWMPFIIPRNPEGMPMPPDGFRQQRMPRAFLGVRISDAMNPEGALVDEVLEDSAAETAGLQIDDVITAVNGEAVTSAEALTEVIAPLDPGTEITLTVIREDETLELTATLGEPPMTQRRMPRP